MKEEGFSPDVFAHSALADVLLPKALDMVTCVGSMMRRWSLMGRCKVEEGPGD